MTTWATIKAELGIFLDDSTATAYPEATRIAAFNRAQQFFAVTHTADIKSATPTFTNGAFTIPSDMIEISGIKVQDVRTLEWRWLEQITIFPASELRDQGYFISDGKIYILDTDIQTPTIYYYTGYAQVTGDSTTITLPFWAEWAVMNLAMAYILYPYMVGVADLRRWQTKREAGDPEDNPPRRQAEYFWDIYKKMVGGFKIQDRGAGYKA